MTQTSNYIVILLRQIGGIGFGGGLNPDAWVKRVKDDGYLVYVGDEHAEIYDMTDGAINLPESVKIQKDMCFVVVRGGYAEIYDTIDGRLHFLESVKISPKKQGDSK